jgi:acylphosphatase
MKIHVHVMISGRVQGVWFRASTKQKADELGLTGWVKNTKDGDVEAVFEGEESLVDEMIAWCWNGPPLAHVTEVTVVQRHHTTQFADFTILRD